MLLIQHRTVGRAEVGDKPDILWERTDLERLFQRLDAEYELGERRQALQLKLELIGDTAQTLLDLLQNRRSLRVEWLSIVILHRRGRLRSPSMSSSSASVDPALRRDPDPQPRAGADLDALVEIENGAVSTATACLRRQLPPPG